MRLTRHFTKNEIKSFELFDGNPDNFTTNDCCNAHNDDLYATRKIYNKLGQLEDIEEKLSIDLITFFKAFKNGVYAFNKEKNIVKGHIAIAYDNGDFENYLRFVLPDRLNCDELCFQNYGKTWALTREELD